METCWRCQLKRESRYVRNVCQRGVCYASSKRLFFFLFCLADYGGESDTDNKHSATAKDSDVSSNVSDIKMETGTGSSLSNYRYKIDYGGVDSTMTIATTVDDQRRSITPKSGCSGGSPTVLSRGIPLAGPVPVDPRYASAGYQRNAVHHPLSNGAVNDYADPINYVRYNNASVSIPTRRSALFGDRIHCVVGSTRFHNPSVDYAPRKIPR